MPASATPPLWLTRNPDGSLKYEMLSRECEWAPAGHVQCEEMTKAFGRIPLGYCDGTGRREITGPGAVAAYWAAGNSQGEEAYSNFVNHLTLKMPRGAANWIYAWGRKTPDEQIEALRSALEATEAAQ